MRKPVEPGCQECAAQKDYGQVNEQRTQRPHRAKVGKQEHFCQVDKQVNPFCNESFARVFLDFGENVLESRFDRDRKSTRLNSSHTVISYAVFCLTKQHMCMVG